MKKSILLAVDGSSGGGRGHGGGVSRQGLLWSDHHDAAQYSPSTP